MAKKKKENDIVTDGSRAITKFHVSDVVMVVILVIQQFWQKESAFGRLALT